MSRRRRAGAAFSLFSFQDIITSVTAILILLVLILALELVAQRQNEAAADQDASRSALRQSAAALEGLVAQLTTLVPSDETRPLAERTQSELERDVRVVEDQARQAVAAAESALAVQERARALAAEAAAKLQGVQELRDEVDRTREEAALLDEEAAKLAIDNAKEAERIAQRRDELSEQPTPGAELVFNAPKDSNGQAWIVEISSDGLVVVKLGTNERRVLGAATGPGSAVDEWVAELDPDRDHALILVRPSGIQGSVDIRETLTEAGVSFGIDFIGEGQVVRDGMGEAAARHAEGGHP